MRKFNLVEKNADGGVVRINGKATGDGAVRAIECRKQVGALFLMLALSGVPIGLTEYMERIRAMGQFALKYGENHSEATVQALSGEVTSAIGAIVAAGAHISRDIVAVADARAVAETGAAAETEAAAEAIETVEFVPDVLEFNLSHQYPEGADEADPFASAGGSIFLKLMEKDVGWMGNLYGQADISPAQMAVELGKPRSSVIGLYNAGDERHDPNDPDSWTINSFNKLHLQIEDGDGAVSSGFSNVIPIMSMANVYTWYNDPADQGAFLEYALSLWDRSHSYSVLMGDVYYCEGCMGESEDGLGVPSAEAGHLSVEEELPMDSENTAGAENRTTVRPETQAAQATIQPETQVAAQPRNQAVVQAENQTVAQSETQGAAQTVAQSETQATAQTETQVTAQPRNQAVVQTENQTVAQSETQAAAQTVAQSETQATAQTETQAVAQPETQAVPQPETQAVAQPETQAAVGPGTQPMAGPENQIAEPAVAKASGPGIQPTLGSNPEGAVEITAAPEHQKGIGCLGHIDLYINARVVGLEEQNNLFKLDSIGKDTDNGAVRVKTENGSSNVTGHTWQGWNADTMSYATSLSSQDWFDCYGLSVASLSFWNPLTEAEIKAHIAELPGGLSKEKLAMIRVALQSVGRIPYYWGGKAQAAGYDGNHFGAVAAPDEDGRLMWGLDCSGWINWVYWTSTGKRLPYESTSGLILCGRPITQSELEPGDIIVRTGAEAHVVMFLGWEAQGQIKCVHETSGDTNNVTISVRDADWPYYIRLMD